MSIISEKAHYKSAVTINQPIYFYKSELICWDVIFVFCYYNDKYCSDGLKHVYAIRMKGGGIST